MNTIVEHINSAGFSFVEFAVPMLVQSGILIVILLLADLLLRKKVKAVFRYWIWMLVLLKLVLPTSLSSPLSLGYLFGEKLTYQDLAETTSAFELADPVPSDNPSGISPIYIQPNVYTPPTMPTPSIVEPAIAGPVGTPAPVTPLSWQGIVFLVWLAVVIAMGLLLLQRALFVRGLVAQAKDAPRLMNDALEYCRESMKIRRKVGLKISPNATTPSVCGLIRPVVLVPWNLASTLGASRLRTVLMHELAHIRRADLWVNLAQTILQIMYFYNPLLWLANCVIRRIREQAVDEAVLVAMGKGAQQYPQTLVDVAKMAFKRPALSLRLIGVVESESALAGRINHILGRPMPKTARLSIVSVLSILITASVLLPMARADRGVVLTVAADGSAEYSSIQKAINAASAGAVVRIAPGVYKEQIKIEKPLTLEGAGWDKTTITAENNTADVFEEAMDKMKEEFARVALKKMQDATTEQERKAIEAEFETEFKAKFKDKFDMQAVLVSDTEGVVIRGLKISFSGRHIEGRLISVPIVRVSSAEAKMSGCVLTGCPGDGIHVMDGSDLEIRNCLVGGLWSTGIVVGEEGRAGSRLRILDSDVRNCYYAGIWIRAGNEPAEIKRCRISGAAWHGIIYSGNSPTIEDNAVFGNARIGIGASYKAAGTVRRNIIYGNEIGGISCSYGSRPVVEGNTFANNKESGLRIFNTAKPIVRKNIFVGNPTAVFCGNFGGDEPSVWFDGVVTLENNLFWDYERKAVWQHLATEDQELKVEDISLGKETGNIEFDPLFADLQGKDFSLRANSPALVSGIGVSEPLAFYSPWPLQDEELAIIPDGDTRDWRLWKHQAESTPKAKAETAADVLAGSLDHFVGKYAMAGHPDTTAFEITKKGDVFVFRDLGVPKFEMDLFLKGLEGRKFEMEKGRDNLKFGDNRRDRFCVRYNAAEDRYILDSLGMRGEVQDSMISPLTDLIKISQEKPADKTNVQVGIEPDSTVQAIPLKAFEFKLVENLLDLVKQVEKQYPQQATHWPAGAGLYHIDAQGQVTVWHYRSLWQRSNDCAPDEVGWGSSQLVNAVGMYYLPDGTPLQSRWRERGGGMKDIRIQVGREVGESERVPVIHRHRLPSNHDLLSSDGLERKLLLDSWKDLPVAIIVRVDKPMRLAGWWLGDVKTDSQHFNEYDQLIVKGPPGNNNKPMLVTVGLPETDVRVWIENNISPKLVMLLDAINSCAAEVDLNIDSVSITDKNISIKGDASDRTNTRKFLDAVKDNGLNVSSLRLNAADNRDKFITIVEPKQDWQQWWQQRKTDVQLGFEETVSPKLVLLLAAIKSVAAEMDLNIESISVSTKSMSIKGDTSRRTETLKFLDAIKDNGLQVSQLNLDSRNGRDRFRMTVEPKENWRQWWQQQKTAVPVEGEPGDESNESKTTEPKAQEPVKQRGGISGVVVNSVTGEPIEGAYVGVGDFGDSGGSNYSRHRSEGFHDKTKTDAEGRFELNGLVFTDKHRDLEYHPLVVTHPDFVRHDEKIELLSSGPAPDVKVSLRPAAKIEVTIVDAEGNPVQGRWLLRLEALDGRRFIPPGSDPHLSSFASNVWAHWPDMRTNMGFSNGFTFTELDSGRYLIEAIRVRLVDKPAPGNIWKPTITYHGSIPSLEIEAGQSKQVRLTPQDNQTQMTITAPEFPDKLFDKLERSSQMPLTCLISRSPGVLLWDDGKIRHLEDHRLGRISKKHFFQGFFSQGQPLVIDNLPPDSYSLFTMAVYGQVAGYLIGARVDLAKGDKITVDIPWRQPTGPSMFGPNRSFDYPVNLEARDYSVSELCGILTEITQSNPRIVADSTIENEKLKFGSGQMSVWDVLEKLYLEKGWKVEEGQDKTLIIRPAEETNMPLGIPGVAKQTASERINSDELSGRIVDEVGDAIADAQVALSTEKIGVKISNGRLLPLARDGIDSKIVQTDKQGRFNFGQKTSDDFDLIVAHDRGFAQIASESLDTPYEIQIRPWGRIEGSLVDNRKATEDKIALWMLPNSTWFVRRKDCYYETKCDGTGRFVFDKVPPGWVEVGYLVPTEEASFSYTCRTPVEVKAGQTVEVILGGSGRPVVGRFVTPDGYDKLIYFGQSLGSLATVRPQKPLPYNYDRMTKRRQQQWNEEWRKTAEYRKYRDTVWHDKNRRHYSFGINEDGSFRVEDVIAGKYQFTVWIEERFTGRGSPEEIASYYGTIEVPEIPAGRSNEPLDLGELELTMYSPLQVGDMAPLFEAETLDGKDLKLIDFRGKFVLLSFWQPVFHPERQQLHELYDAYGANGPLKIIGLVGNDTLEEVRNYVQEYSIPWPQIFIGEESQSSIAKNYNLPGIPSILLIGPDGRIIAKNLRGEKLKSTVNEILEAAKPNKTNVSVEGEREDTSASNRIEFLGLDLTDAPRTTKSADLPDLFEARPPGSKSYHRREDIDIVYSGLVGNVYYIPDKEIFYIQHDKLGASTLTYYGPFNGDPKQVLDIEKDMPIKAGEAEAGSGDSEVTANESGPRITFESLVCDLGQVPPRTKHVCEFKFTNTGNEVMEITKVHSTCGCIISKLKKKEYAPGESETLEATYQSSASAGQVKKYVFVYSNDEANPKVILTVKAEIVIKVAHEPKKLNLVLDKENAGCPVVTLTSIDNQPFSITGFKSTGDSITADFDTSVKETSFVIQPKVDMEKLRKGPKGQVEISLTHPECKKISILFDTLPEFKTDPRVVYVRDAEPLKTVTKKVWIRSNYNEDVEVESTSSKKGIVKVLAQEKIRNGYQFELEITPPLQESNKRVFTDVFTVVLKGGQQIQITCYGIYSKKPEKTRGRISSQNRYAD